MKVYRDGTVIGKSGKPLKVSITNSGYLRAGKYLVHRLLAERYLPNPYNYKYINHKDGNKLNNDLSNLEWCTQKYNLHHSLSQGKGNLNFTKKDIENIKELYSQGLTHQAIADYYNVNRRLIGKIIRGQRYNFYK